MLSSSSGLSAAKAERTQTQEAICFFVERAEAAEKRVRELESRLGLPSTETSNGDFVGDDGAAVSFTPGERSPKPSVRAVAPLAERRV